MPPPASPPRPPLACLACLICPFLLGGCGNRGELYLAADLEPAVEADLRPLGAAPDVPDDGAAPTSSPSLAPEGEAGAPPARRRPRGDVR